MYKVVILKDFDQVTTSELINVEQIEEAMHITCYMLLIDTQLYIYTCTENKHNMLLLSLFVNIIPNVFSKNE